MAFPHQKSRQKNDRKEDKPKNRGVLLNLLSRTINVTEYRKAKADVNPAKHRTFGGISHDWFVILFIGGTASNLLLNFPEIRAQPDTAPDRRQPSGAPISESA